MFFGESLGFSDFFFVSCNFWSWSLPDFWASKGSSVGFMNSFWFSGVFSVVLGFSLSSFEVLRVLRLFEFSEVISVCFSLFEILSVSSS